jgi:hypothetical protein
MPLMLVGTKIDVASTTQQHFISEEEQNIHGERLNVTLHVIMIFFSVIFYINIYFNLTHNSFMIKGSNFS